MSRNLLLDRDGTLCQREHYLTRPDQVVLLPGVGEALSRASELGIRIFVLTNQSAVGRGLLTFHGLSLVHERLASLLADYGVQIDDIFVCPHHPHDLCGCRKPKDGLFRQLEVRYSVTPGECVMVGDSPSDSEAAEAWGCRFVGIRGDLVQSRTPIGKWCADSREAIGLATDLLA